MTSWTLTLWLICYVIVFAGLSAFGAHRLRILWLYWKHRKEEPEPTSKFAELPVVTVQLPVFNEVHVVRRLLESVSQLDYPREKLQIQILDDSTDETKAVCEDGAAELRAQGFDVEHLHRTNRVGFKAGALDEAMNRVKGEFIMIFDADFLPGPDVLRKMIDFFTDEKVGLVQARWEHGNRKDSLLTRLQAMMLDGHLALEQPARSRGSLFFNFNGTAGIWRKKAIIDAGGWEHDTLTEDMDLSYRAQMKGWRFHYLKDVSVPAELPPDMDGFKSQQHRWTKGSVQVCKKMLGRVWKSDQSLRVKLEATAHLTVNFTYLLMLCVLIMVYPSNFVFESGPVKMLLVDLPVFFFATVSSIVFYTSAQMVLARSAWDWIKCLPLLPLLLALGIGMSINNGMAVLEALFNKQSDFVRTPKYGQQAVAQRKRSRYKATRSISFWLEFALAIYFSALLVGAMLDERWLNAVFLGLFQFGFTYVVASSAMRWFSGLNLSPPPPPQEASSDPAIA
ncbi:glycosyltransferase [Phragmitibacter flavus]|uniref:Glycosyltransferase n=1 Tax=Phragmitibacter flavus TaxID=2576071 RepID=A0A5R8KCK4_9BACT|nr:glycosyltransferase [Phragmitibacter flavus]TLD70023.1 glycosyltransferase [Phragmitibacter flavus]